MLRSLAVLTILFSPSIATAAPVCEARTGATQNPVIELYTSEGCSSCPPADRWLSTLTANINTTQAVVQSFHVSYWDYIGWKDRFASPEYTARQRQIAIWHNARQVFTPQITRDGSNSEPFKLSKTTKPARATIVIASEDKNQFVAEVVPNDPNATWAAYWTVTEDGHSSKVKAGENRGETLKHDFVVRQYVEVASQRGKGRVNLKANPAEAAHLRRVNLTVYDPATGTPWQAVSLPCS